MKLCSLWTKFVRCGPNLKIDVLVLVNGFLTKMNCFRQLYAFVGTRLELIDVKDFSLQKFSRKNSLHLLPNTTLRIKRM